MIERLPESAQRSLADAAQYARDINTGKIPSGKFVKLAVERHYRDLDDGHRRGLVFDEYAAGRVLAFFGYLRHSKGEWAGQIVELAPWQAWIISVVFGWVYEETGLRRFRTIYEEIARKNGKTTKLGGIGLYLLVKDNEPGAEIYSAATKRDQAKIMFSEAKNMVNQSRDLAKRLTVHINNISYLATNSKFEPLSADANSLDGLNPHGALIDELHAHKTREMFDVLVSAFGSRRQHILWNITTAGFNANGVCYEVRDYTTKVLQGVVDDDSHFGAIYTIDKDDDPFDETNWIKANPNLGVSVKLDYLRDNAKRAREMPSAMNNFLTKHLNVWVSSETLWMNMIAWQTLGVTYSIEDLADAVDICGGLDLSSVSDICSFALVARMQNGKIRTWHRHYLPKDAVMRRVQKNQVPYDVWARDGWLTLTPGNTVDYNYIKKDIKDVLEKLRVREIAFDRWNSSQLVNDLTDDGVPMVGFGQGFQSMSSPMKELERMVLSGEFEHPNDPVFTWAMSNLVAKEDEAGNIKPAKNKSVEKIDPAVAAIMGLGRLIVTPESTDCGMETL